MTTVSLHFFLSISPFYIKNSDLLNYIIYKLYPYMSKIKAFFKEQYIEELIIYSAYMHEHRLI